MTDARRYPHAIACGVAREVFNALRPECERLLVAGSIRRLRPVVKDIELVYIPKLDAQTVHARDLLGEEIVEMRSAVDVALERLLAAGLIEKRKNVNGSKMWGETIRHARHCRSGIPIDFFEATPGNWFNQVVCRTGPKESNVRICMAARKLGWKWHPTGIGFESTDGPGEIWHTVTSEDDVFEFVGLRPFEPKDRK